MVLFGGNLHHRASPTQRANVRRRPGKREVDLVEHENGTFGVKRSGQRLRR